MIQKMVFTCLMLASSVAALPGGALGMERKYGNEDQLQRFVVNRAVPALPPSYDESMAAAANTGARAKAQTKESLLIEALGKKREEAMQNDNWIEANGLWQQITDLRSLVHQKNDLKDQLSKTESNGRFSGGEINKIEEVTFLSQELAKIQEKIDSLDPSPAPASQASATSSSPSAPASSEPLEKLIDGIFNGIAGKGQRSAPGKARTAYDVGDNIRKETEKLAEECTIQ